MDGWVRRTYSSDDIDDWCNVSLVLVDFTVLFSDQTPESVNVDSWAPQTVLQDAEGSHTDLTEVTWMALKRQTNKNVD